MPEPTGISCIHMWQYSCGFSLEATPCSSKWPNLNFKRPPLDCYRRTQNAVLCRACDAEDTLALHGRVVEPLLSTSKSATARDYSPTSAACSASTWVLSSNMTCQSVFIPPPPLKSTHEFRDQSGRFRQVHKLPYGH